MNLKILSYPTICRPAHSPLRPGSPGPFVAALDGCLLVRVDTGAPLAAGGGFGLRACQPASVKDTQLSRHPVEARGDTKLGIR